jgi:hypothetical protein
VVAPPQMREASKARSIQKRQGEKHPEAPGPLAIVIHPSTFLARGGGSDEDYDGDHDEDESNGGCECRSEGQQLGAW